MLSKKLIIAIMFILMLAAGSVQAGGDAAKGAELAAEDTPGIAGMDAAAHVKELQAFKSGERVDEDEMMFDYVEELSDQDMADLAAYFATLPAE